MKIKSISSFKDYKIANAFFYSWVKNVSYLNGTNYHRQDIETSLGNTVVWSINATRQDLETIVIFPGFRTCSLFWDLDNNLAPLKKDHRIFLIETNGQPTLSEGKTPDIKTNDYGMWATELLDKLFIDKAVIAGASFGGLICLKLCLVSPYRVKKAILLNPGCLQSFSLKFKNLYYNFLPLIAPSRKNIEKFLDKAVFYKDKHVLSKTAKKLIIDYELFAITEFKDKTQKPYPLSKKDLAAVTVDTYLILGDKDILFPYKKSLKIASDHIRSLQKVFIVHDTGHGIETSRSALEILEGIVNDRPVSFFKNLSTILN